MKNLHRKVLLVVPEYSSFYKPYCEAFKKLGIDYKLFDNRKTIFLEKVIFVFSRIFKPLSPLPIKMINLRLLLSVKSYKPDLVLVIKGENIFPETIIEIRKKTTVVNYFSDYFRWFSDSQIQSWLKAYQIVYTGDLLDVTNYTKNGFNNLFHIHLAGPEIKNIPIKKKYDVVFVGAYSKEREKTFKKLLEFNFKIWGDKKWANSSLGKYYMDEWLSAEKALDVFANSKIVVNFHNDLSGKNRYINLRVFEATAAESLLISDLRQDLPSLFKIKKEIVIYKDSSDLKDKVRFYLENDKERKKIARKGYQRCMRDHTYEKRLEQMFKHLSTIQNPA